MYMYVYIYTHYIIALWEIVNVQHITENPLVTCVRRVRSRRISISPPSRPHPVTRIHSYPGKMAGKPWENGKLETHPKSLTSSYLPVCWRCGSNINLQEPYHFVDVKGMISCSLFRNFPLPPSPSMAPFFFLRCHPREEKITVRKRENVKDPKELISEAPSGRQLPQW